MLSFIKIGAADSNNLKQRFEYTLGNTPSSYTQNGNSYYIISDHLGSPRIITDANGNVLKEIEYDSFDNVISDTNPAIQIPFGFAGGLTDTDTGLIRFGYRDYDPIIGRWTALDPIGFAGGDTNLYGYVFSDPVNFVDPRGLLVVVVSRYVQNSFGLAAHTSIWVIGNNGTITTISSSSTYENGQNIISFNHSDDNPDQVTINEAVYIAPPPGISQSDFDNAVLREAAKAMMSPLEKYKFFPDKNAGSGGHGGSPSEGNCHSTTSKIIEAAGAHIPNTFHPSGRHPGLH